MSRPAGKRSLRAALLSLLAALVLCGSAPAASAAPEPGSAGEAIEAFLDRNGISRELIAVGYMDFTTGEEYLVSGDREMFAASLYKVSLNMLWDEKIAAGEASLEETRIANLPLDYLMEQSLVYSNNLYSATLMDGLGGLRPYRLQAARLYGMTEEEALADRKYIRDNYLTARRMLRCLEALYRDRELYPNVTELMLAAEPGAYFRLDGDRWPVAQKYGYMGTKWGLDLNCAGIIYAPEPFALVVMTHNVYEAEERMSELCALLGELSERRAAERATPAPTETPAPTPEPTAAPTGTPAPTAAPSDTPAPTAVPSPTPAAERAGTDAMRWLPIGAGALAVAWAAATIVFLRRSRRK